MKFPSGKTLAPLGMVAGGALAAMLGAHVLERDKIGPLPTVWALPVATATLAMFAGGKYRNGLFLAAGGAALIGALAEVKKRLEAPKVAGYGLGAGQLYQLPAGGQGVAYPQMFESAGIRY